MKQIRYILFFIVVSLAIASIYVFKAEPFYSFSLRFNDINFALQPNEASKDILFVKVDEESVDQFGRWPWDRSILAKAIDNLDSSNVLILDMVFSEVTEDDAMLAEALENHGNNICGFFLRQKASAMLSHEQGDILSDSSLYRLSQSLGNKTVFVEGNEAETNTASILEACTMSATFSTLRDKDQLFRHYPIAFTFRGEIYPSLGTQAMRLKFNKDISVLEDKNYDLAGHEVATNERGFTLLNYYPKESYQTASFMQLYNDELDIKDKIVILGITEVGVGDIRATPVGILPGPLVHYTFLSNVLNDELLIKKTWVGYISIGLFLLLPLIWLIISSVTKRVIVYAVVYGLFFGLSKVLYINYNLYVDVFYPLLALLAMGGFSEVYLHKLQESQSKFIEEAFASYLSPVLLEKLMQEPERLALGGEKKELTVFFSDIRSFTTISESMDPQKLTKYLNRYFTPMSDIVMEHQGMIDKYIGDAVMAFYNAPLDVPDHADLACDASLKMLAVLRELNIELEAEGLPRIDIGIGLNTAEVVVGNMGSDKRFNYTVIGDGVNLASRVEGINKTYGTSIIITEFTKAKISSRFLTREIEKVRVKGKEEEVLLYELLPNTPENKKRVESYMFALDLYKDGKMVEALESFKALNNDSVGNYFIEKIGSKHG